MKKVLGFLIVLLVLVDAFFISYAVALNLRKQKIVDPGLAKQITATKTVTTTTTSEATEANTITTDTSGSTTGNTITSDTSGSTANTITSDTSRSVAGTTTAKSFTDLKDTDKRLQSSLEKAADAGILDPSKDKQFRPNDPVTRADFARWMVRIRQIPKQEPGIPTYTDVDKGNPYYAEIEGATKAMMVQGYNQKDSTDKLFKPDQNITRQEFAVMYGTFSGKRSRAEQLKKDDIEKYLRYNTSTSKSGDLTFKDSGDVDDWALKWVAVANQAGVLEQCFDVDAYSTEPDKKYLHPQQQMTRAEAVNILVKLYGAQSRNAVQEPGTASDTAPESKASTASSETKDDEQEKKSQSTEGTKTE